MIYCLDREGNTLLHLACRVHRRAQGLITRLLDACPEALHQYNKEEETPLFLVLNEYIPSIPVLETISLLVEADPSITYQEDESCHTPLMVAQEAYEEMRDYNESHGEYYDLASQMAIIKKLREADEVYLGMRDC